MSSNNNSNSKNSNKRRPSNGPSQEILPCGPIREPGPTRRGESSGSAASGGEVDLLSRKCGKKKKQAESRVEVSAMLNNTRTADANGGGEWEENSSVSTDGSAMEESTCGSPNRNKEGNVTLRAARYALDSNKDGKLLSCAIQQANNQDNVALHAALYAVDSTFQNNKDSAPDGQVMSRLLFGSSLQQQHQSLPEDVGIPAPPPLRPPPPRPDSAPGAFPHRGIDYGNGGSGDDEEASIVWGTGNESGGANPNNNNGLVEARAVPGCSHLSLGHALEVDPTEQQEREATRKKKTMKLVAIGVGIGAITIGIVALLAAMVGSSSSQENGIDPVPSLVVPSTVPSQSPSGAPSGVLDSFVEGLPNWTSAVLSEGGITAQSKALQWLREHPNITHMEDWRKRQLLALVAFFYAMEGEQWYLVSVRSHWLKDDRSECFWYSVPEQNSVATSFLDSPWSFGGDSISVCDNHNRIQSLDLSTHLALASTLPGIVEPVSIPPQLALLTSLSRLNMAYNFFNTTIDAFLPEELYHMENLTRLNLFQAGLSGEIPSELGLMSGLEELNLAQNFLTGPLPSQLGLLTNMEFFNCIQSALTGTLPRQLGNMTRTTSLLLQSNRITGPVPSQLGRMVHLKALDLESNDLSGPIPTEVGSITSLEILKLSYNGLTGTLPSEMGRMSNMKNLNLDSNAFRGTVPTELGLLTDLFALTLYDNQLSGTVPESLCSVPVFGFDCSDNLCGCCWCPCPGTSYDAEDCGVDGDHFNPSRHDKDWPGSFPVPVNRSNNVIAFNIRKDRTFGARTVIEWSALDDSGSWKVLDSQNIIGANGVRSYNHRVDSETLYRLRLFDASDTCCSWGKYGWFAVTNSTQSGQRNGTVVWETSGSAVENSLSVFLWVDSNGHSQYVANINAQISDLLPTELSTVQSLTILDFFNSSNLTLPRLTGSIPSELGLMTSMTKLNLESNNLMGLLSSQLGLMTSATQLILSHNSLMGQLPSELGLMINATWLNLDNNWFSGTLPTELAEMTNVSGLCLQHNRLGSSLPSHLGLLSSITELRFHNNQLTGRLPTELGMLSLTKKLLLSINRLTGAVPSELGLLASAVTLDLWNNKLTGALPTELGLMSSLTNVDLSRNRLKGALPSELGLLAGMTSIRIPFNRLTASIPTEFGMLTNMEFLSCYLNALTGPIPRELGQMTSMTKLDFESNLLSGSLPTELGLMSNMASLDLGYNSFISGPIPSELGLLAKMTNMQLRINSLTGAIPSELAMMTYLPSLNLQDNSLMGALPTELGLMANMKELHLHNNRLTFPLPSQLGLMSGITLAYLHGNSLTGSLPSELGRMTKVKIFHVHDNSMTGLLPSELGLMTSMSELHLYQNHFVGTLPSHLGQITNMKELKLQHNRLAGPLPSMFGQMTNMEHLQLLNNSMGGSLPSELGLMTSMRHLSLSSNYFSGRLPSELALLTGLLHLSFEGNSLSGTIPESFCSIISLNFDCGENFCGCCWCPCPGKDYNEECTIPPHFFDPSRHDDQWPGSFPAPIARPNVLTINIRTNTRPSQTSFEWSVRNESGFWELSDVQQGRDFYPDQIHSYRKDVGSNTLYRLQLFDSEGHGICCGTGRDHGWFTITNSTPSPSHAEGSIVWEARGDVLENPVNDGFSHAASSLDIFLWIDSNGNAQQVMHVPGEGYARVQYDITGRDDIIVAPDDAMVNSTTSNEITSGSHTSGGHTVNHFVWGFN